MSCAHELNNDREEYITKNIASLFTIVTSEQWWTV